MSEIFRLLSRSTKLQKTENDSSKHGDRKLPSAGVPVRPNIFANPEQSSEPLKENKRGKKRKRVRPSLQADHGEEGPDFFKGLDPVQSKEELSQGKQELEDVSHVNIPANPLQRLQEAMPVDERKRILKSHKLKINVMNLDAERTRSKEVQKSASQSGKRSGPFPIFPAPLLSFQDLRSKYRVSKRLVENIRAQGYTIPTEVQMGCLPILLGNNEESGTPPLTSLPDAKPSLINLLTIAPTGSGKTLAFLIPIIQQLQQDSNSTSNLSSNLRKSSLVRSIIVVPTHELMDQVVNEARKLVMGTGLRVTAMRKGMQLAQATDDAESDNEVAMGTVVKSDILVSTPLMLVNSLNETTDSKKSLPSIQSLVLDEADILLDPLFREQTLDIWRSCTNPDLQISLWSATIGSSIEHLAQQMIGERKKLLGLKESQAFIVRVVAGLKDSALPTISHKLVYAASEQGKLLAMRQLLRPTATSDSKIATLRPPFIVFTQTIPRANALHSELLYDIPIEAGGSKRIAVLHSSLSDTTRSNIMSGFRKGEIWVIITTDLLARGIDFRGLNGVVNYDIPNTSAAYVHRAGRTGRAGREGGTAVTFYTKDDIPYVKNIANVIAASEKAHGKPQAESGVQQWLLDALPDVSKKTKQDLKKKGVAARRPTTSFDGKSQEARRSRISTKSGFDRRKENKKRDAVAARERRFSNRDMSLDGSGSEDEWQGLD